jgi:hypothetical protein
VIVTDVFGEGGADDKATAWTGGEATSGVATGEIGERDASAPTRGIPASHHLWADLAFVAAARDSSPASLLAGAVGDAGLPAYRQSSALTEEKHASKDIVQTPMAACLARAIEAQGGPFLLQVRRPEDR